jgi:probable rRNA maturation factor
VTAQVFAADEQSDRPVDLARWVSLAEEVLGDRGVGDRAELSLMFVDEVAIASLNERFLGRKGATDVLSFPIEDELIGPSHVPDPEVSGPGRGPLEPEDMPLLVGDVVICPEVAWRQAPEHAGTYDDELALLLVHGILHLLGMDHAEDGEAAAMEALEQQLLAAHHRQAGSGS